MILLLQHQQVASWVPIAGNASQLISASNLERLWCAAAAGSTSLLTDTPSFERLWFIP